MTHGSYVYVFAGARFVPHPIVTLVARNSRARAAELTPHFFLAIAAAAAPLCLPTKASIFFRTCALLLIETLLQLKLGGRSWLSRLRAEGKSYYQVSDSSPT